MPKQKTSRDGQSSKFGVSTSADVKAFRAASSALTGRVTTSKESARAYVRDLEKRAGIGKKK